MKTLSTIVVLVGSLVSGVLFIEDRYAHSADLESFSTEQKVHITKTINDFKRTELQDKIFIQEFKEQSGDATPLDRALKERYLEQLRNIEE